MGRTWNQIIDKIQEQRAEIKELELKMECSMLLEKLFPVAQWPVYTSIYQDPVSRKFWFRIRDSNRDIKVLEIRDIPLILLQRPHIQEACKTNKALDLVINRRKHGETAVQHNSCPVEDSK